MLHGLGQSFLSSKDPAFYDINAKSYQELIANIHAKVNECVAEINSFTENMDVAMKDFVSSDEKSKAEHMTAIRQEFQDFIDIINLKVMELQNSYSIYDGELETWKNNQETARKTFENQTKVDLEEWKENQETVIDDAKRYMQENIIETTRVVAKQELENQNITFELVYNPETKDLNIAYGGGN